MTAGERGTFFLEQHLLYVVLGGSVKLTSGRQSWTVRKNEMILLRRAQSLGIENPTHFSRIFKQQYGYAPSQS